MTWWRGLGGRLSRRRAASSRERGASGRLPVASDGGYAVPNARLLAPRKRSYFSLFATAFQFTTFHHALT